MLLCYLRRNYNKQSKNTGENAERREARLEKEKVAEKAEVKGGIHGRLEKAKAEIKAKGTDTIPKSKARDLATAL